VQNQQIRQICWFWISRFQSSYARSSHINRRVSWYFAGLLG